MNLAALNHQRILGSDAVIKAAGHIQLAVSVDFQILLGENGSGRLGVQHIGKNIGLCIRQSIDGAVSKRQRKLFTFLYIQRCAGAALDLGAV